MGIAGPKVHTAAGAELEISRSGSVAGERPYALLARELPWLSGAYAFGGVAARLGSGDGGGERETGLAEAQAGRLEWSGGPILAVSHAVRMTYELNWKPSEGTTGDGQNRLFFTPGAIWKMPPGAEVGVGVSVPLTGSARYYRVTISLVREFESIMGWLR